MVVGEWSCPFPSFLLSFRPLSSHHSPLVTLSVRALDLCLLCLLALTVIFPAHFFLLFLLLTSILNTLEPFRFFLLFSLTYSLYSIEANLLPTRPHSTLGLPTQSIVSAAVAKLSPLHQHSLDLFSLLFFSFSFFSPTVFYISLFSSFSLLDFFLLHPPSSHMHFTTPTLTP